MRKLLKILIILAILGGFLLWGNFSIDVEEKNVTLPALPREFDGLRIVQLSDLHGRNFGFDNKHLLSAVQQAAPDLICITGDLFDEDTDLSMLPPLLTGLVALAPTYFVTGNHEWQLPNLREILKDMEYLGVQVLQDDYRFLERNGKRLIIAGVDDPCGPLERLTPSELILKIRKAEGMDVPILMLSHRNDEIALWSDLDVMLVLSGHSHGGVVRLPLLGGVIGTERQLFPDYDAGLYRKNGTALYVSRGLGFSGVQFRLFNRPQLPVLILNH